MTNTQSKEIKPTIVPFKYIPEDIFGLIKEYAVPDPICDEYKIEKLKPKVKKVVETWSKSKVAELINNSCIFNPYLNPLGYKCSTKKNMIDWLFTAKSHTMFPQDDKWLEQSWENGGHQDWGWDEEMEHREVCLFMCEEILAGKSWMYGGR
jgi:hypothetical protein